MKVLPIFIAALASLATQAALTPEQVAKLPPAASQSVNFKQDIQPILEASCVKCHGRGKDKGGFAIDNRDIFLKGGDSGPAVIPGKSAESFLIELVSGFNEEMIMPEKGSKLTPDQVGLLRAWIDQGLPWDEGVSFAKLPPVNLHPRKPEIPEVSGVEHPIDRFIDHYFASHQISKNKVVDDRTFARRVYLDTIGLLPTPSELESFMADQAPDKRSRLVQRLLARNHDYAQHWLTFWNDALRNDYRGTGYIDGGRKQITGWLYAALAGNKPYDQFVGELINPTPESEGFAKGIIWRGVVNASQTPQMQAAQNISQVFMGVNLKCASCHDSFINDWTLADAYGLASIYADGPLEMFKCDAPTGKTASLKFIYPELGAIDSKLEKKDRLEQLAEIVTSEKNGRLTRTIVNRLWARLLGRGFIEPVDEMDHPAWNQDLLDWLSADLAGNGFNLKRTLELIMTSRTYQLPAVPVAEQTEKEFVFRGPLVRRMSAEQFLDAVSEITGVWYETPAAQLSLSGEKTLDANLAGSGLSPKWIWKDAQAAQATEQGTVYFRKFVDLPEEPEQAALIVTCDNSFRLWINGVEAGSGKDHTKPAVIDGRKQLRKGINLIAIEARNWPGSPNNPEADQKNPGGLFVYGRVRQGNSEAEVKMDFVSDSSWLWSAVGGAGWETAAYPAAGWDRAAELGKPDIGPWKLGSAIASRVSSAALQGQVRAALVAADPLMVALGRPNREQVITSRPSAASTLQALELTNGPTLASKLKQAAEKLGAELPTPESLVNELYRRALGRPATSAELTETKELFGSRVEREDVEDLLWAMVMLPEFQLIY